MIPVINSNSVNFFLYLIRLVAGSPVASSVAVFVIS